MLYEQISDIKRWLSSCAWRVLVLKIPNGCDGAVLVNNLYLSCDPYMIGRMRKSEGHCTDAFALGSVYVAKKRAYTNEEINEVREQWARFFWSRIFVGTN